MRRPRPTTLARWCLTCLTAVLATAWALSASWQLRWAGFAGSTYYTGQSARGQLEFTLARPLGNVGWTLGWDLRSRASADRAALATVSFNLATSAANPWWGQWSTTTSPNFRRDQVAIHYWLLTLPCAIATALTWLPVLTSPRRKRAGLCPTCAYDRRGLAPDAPCPECGTTPAIPTK